MHWWCCYCHCWFGVAFYLRCRRRRSRSRSYVNKSGCSFVIGWTYYYAHSANGTCYIEYVRMKMGQVLIQRAAIQSIDRSLVSHTQVPPLRTNVSCYMSTTWILYRLTLWIFMRRFIFTNKYTYRPMHIRLFLSQRFTLMQTHLMFAIDATNRNHTSHAPLAMKFVYIWIFEPDITTNVRAKTHSKRSGRNAR